MNKKREEFYGLLVTPPAMLPEIPPISTAVLKGYLSRRGYSHIRCADLSLSFAYYLMEHMSVSKKEDSLMTETGIKLRALDMLNNRWELNNDFVYIEKEDMQPQISHWASPFVFSYYELLDKMKQQGERVRHFLSDRKKNIYLSFWDELYRQKAYDFNQMDFVGFSMIGFFQVIPALTFAACIKEEHPDIHITFGGPWVTLYADVIPEIFQQKEFVNLADSFSFGEGEESLYYLMEALCKRCEKESIPNIILKQDGKFTRNPIIRAVDMEQVSSPDYSDFQLDQYLSFIEGRGQLAVQSSRGCYHAACAFCNALTNLPCKKYREKSKDSFLRELDELIKQYPTVALYDFADSVSTKERLCQIANYFSQNSPDKSWEIDIRLERWVDEELIGWMKHSNGLLRFGLESASDRLLKRMKKGNDLSNVNRILDICRRMNYKPLLMTIIGLPGESQSEAEQLEQYLLQYGDTVFSLVENFNLERNTDIYANPQKYGIQILNKEASLLSPYYSFSRIEGYTNEQEKAIYKKVFFDIMRKECECTHADIQKAQWEEITLSCLFETIGKIKMELIYNNQPFQELNPHFKYAMAVENIVPSCEAVVLPRGILQER